MLKVHALCSCVHMHGFRQVVVPPWDINLTVLMQDELRIQNTQCDNCLIGCMVASQARPQADSDMRSAGWEKKCSE